MRQILLSWQIATIFKCLYGLIPDTVLSILHVLTTFGKRGRGAACGILVSGPGRRGGELQSLALGVLTNGNHQGSHANCLLLKLNELGCYYVC